MDKGHLLSQRFGPDARKWKYEQFNDPTLNQEPGFLAKSGSYEDCTNESGAFDMVGNLHEWVSDMVDQAFVDRMDEEPLERKHQGWKEGNGVFMGGFFSTHEQLGPGCKYTTIAHEPSYHDYSTGFRCCATLPKPPKEPKAPKAPKR
jgi:formylglycine-generating enzyme required for sulfatase activity